MSSPRLCHGSSGCSWSPAALRSSRQLWLRPVAVLGEAAVGGGGGEVTAGTGMLVAGSPLLLAVWLWS